MNMECLWYRLFLTMGGSMDDMNELLYAALLGLRDLKSL